MKFFKKKEEEKMEYTEVRDGTGSVFQTIIEEPYRDPIVQGSASWKKMKTRMEYWLQENVGDHIIDEVALMFDDRDNLMNFIKAAVQDPGVKLFNAANDHVVTSPIPSEYWVEYFFLEVEDLGMRVECMYIDRGISPLHESLKSHSYNPTCETASIHDPIVIHFSFKVPPSKYEETCEKMGKGVNAAGVQWCSSTYGKFAYYRVTDFGHNLYLKPRTNTRDAAQEPGPNTTTGADRGDFGYPGVGRAGRPITDSPQA